MLKSSCNLIICLIFIFEKIKRIIWSFIFQGIWFDDLLLSLLGLNLLSLCGLILLKLFGLILFSLLWLIIRNFKKKIWGITHPNQRVKKFKIYNIILIKYLGLIQYYELISINWKKLNEFLNIYLSHNIFLRIKLNYFAYSYLLYWTDIR